MIIPLYFSILLLALSGCMLNSSKNVAGPTTSPESVPVIPSSPIVEKVTSTSAGLVPQGSVVDIQVYFSTNVVVTGYPRMKLATGIFDKFATYSSGSGTKILNFEYRVGAGDQTSQLDYFDVSSLDLNGGNIVSESGVNALLSLPAPSGGSSLANSAAISFSDSVPAANTYNIISAVSAFNVQGSAVSDSSGILYTTAGSAGLANKVFRSLDKGATWISIYEFPSSANVTSIKFDGEKLWLSKIDNDSHKIELMKSTNGGVNWTSVREFTKQINTVAYGLADVVFESAVIETRNPQEIWINYGYYYYDCCNGGGDDVQYSFTTKQYSVDTGLTWSTEIDTSVSGFVVSGLFFNSVKGFSISNNSLSALMLPGFTAWTSVADASLTSLTAGAASDQYVFIGNYQANSWKISRGDSQGSNWSVVDNFSGHAGFYHVKSIKAYKDYIFTCGRSPRADGQSQWLIRYSKDYGTNWFTLDTFSEAGNSNSCNDLVIQSDGYVYAFGYAGSSGASNRVIARQYKF